MGGCLAGGLAARIALALTGISVESYGREGVVGQVRLVGGWLRRMTRLAERIGGLVLLVVVHE